MGRPVGNRAPADRAGPTVGRYCDFDMVSCFIVSWDILLLPIVSWLIVAWCFIDSEDMAPCFIVSCDIPRRGGLCEVTDARLRASPSASSFVAWLREVTATGGEVVGYCLLCTGFFVAELLLWW
jgi:hypothetical protein